MNLSVNKFIARIRHGCVYDDDANHGVRVIVIQIPHLQHYGNKSELNTGKWMHLKIEFDFRIGKNDLTPL